MASTTPRRSDAAVAERMKAAGAEELLRRRRGDWPLSTPDRSGARASGAPRVDGESRAVNDDASAEPGRVYLVGAGPGDPGLLTARALELIAAADVILYDRLIPSAALDGARAEAEVLFVGKEGGGPSVPQEQTEALILDRARAGMTVVRLKGGDPFVFGRGGEEALALREAGIAFEIVPGITSGVAAAAYAGIPVTHRGLATAVALVTGHTREDGPEESALDWPALAAFPGTLVFYMGVRQLPQIARSLIAAGRPADEPVAIVERGTLPDQRDGHGDAADDRRGRAGGKMCEPPRSPSSAPSPGSPSELEWREHGDPISAQRPHRRGHACARPGQRLGAAPGRAGASVVSGAGDPHRAAARTGARARALRPRLLHQPERGRGAVRAPRAGARGAARSLTWLSSGRPRVRGRTRGGDRPRHGAHAGRARAARGHRARALGRRVARAGARRRARRSARSSRARRRRATCSPTRCAQRGAEVDVLALYETVAEPLSPQRSRHARDGRLHHLHLLLDRALLPRRGRRRRCRPLAADAHRLDRPVTSETLREHGLEPHVEASDHDVDGVIQALLEDLIAQQT